MTLLKGTILLALATAHLCAYAQGTIELFGGNARPTNFAGVTVSGMQVGYYFGDVSAVVGPGSTDDGLSAFFIGVVNASSPYLNDGIRSVGAGHLGGDTVIVQVRSWSGAYNSFQTAYAASLTDCTVRVGVSRVMTLKLGGTDINGNTFATPSLAANGQLKSWSLFETCPEPSTTALALIGGAMLLRKMRRRSS